MIGYELQIVDKDGKTVAGRLFLGHDIPRVGETLEILPVGSLDNQLKNEVESLLQHKGWLREDYAVSEFWERVHRESDFHNKFAGRYDVLDVQHVADLHFCGGTGNQGFASVASKEQNLIQILVNTYGSCGYGEQKEASTQAYLPRIKVRAKDEL